jgi:ribosomal-protein-alanine N-acetyltransferase
VAGRGITPTALALTVDHCLTEARLHRVEVNIRPENQASIRVVEKLRLRQEGYHERFLDIDGGWRDHLSFAVTTEEILSGGTLSRLSALPVPPG